jgi:hypothetical protein
VVWWGECWSLVPKIAGSSEKIHSGSKTVSPMSQIFGMLKNPVIYVEVGITGQINRQFLARNSVLHWQRSLMSLGVERLWRWRTELKGGTQRPAAYRSGCNGVVTQWPRSQSTSYVVFLSVLDIVHQIVIRTALYTVRDTFLYQNWQDTLVKIIWPFIETQVEFFLILLREFRGKAISMLPHNWEIPDYSHNRDFIHWRLQLR